MTLGQLHHLLCGIEDTREVVIDRAPCGDVLHEVWREAQDEADALYAVWRHDAGRERYVAYRAAADRADAALDALAAEAA